MALAGSRTVLHLIDISKLKPHEEIIPEHLMEVQSQLKKDGIQKDPIIVDLTSRTVLDGMHRLAAFSSLGIDRVVCFEVNYDSDIVQLERWARAYGPLSNRDIEEVKRVLSGAERISASDGLAELQTGEIGVALFSGKNAFVNRDVRTLNQAFEVVRGIDRVRDSRGWKRVFISEDSINARKDDPRNLVVVVKALSKSDVLQAASSGHLFPCKTSMHSVDPRPVGVNFPIGLLSNESNGEVILRLKDRRSRLLPPGTNYEGRKYKERLLVLEGIDQGDMSGPHRDGRRG